VDCRIDSSSKRVVELQNQIETHLAKVDSLKSDIRNLRTQRRSLNDEVDEKKLCVNDLISAVEDSLKLDNAELRKDQSC
jgi:chromosome segregation ATPase